MTRFSLASSILIAATMLQTAWAYSCDPNTCKLPACYCPSKNPPGGLSPRNIPQTLDDAITALNLPVIMEAMGNNQRYRNPNGCPVPATFFVSNDYTDYDLLSRTYHQGNEIGVHTMTHPNGPSAKEIIGSHRALQAWGGVPRKDLIGFRTPFLNYSTDTFKYLRGSGMFLYDSSMTMNPGDAYWPYTLDNGPVNACVTGTCEPGMKIPGLWEIPIWLLQNTDGSINSSLDPSPVPGADPLDLKLPTGDQVLAMWKYNFDRNYRSNRIPFGVFLHTLWIIRDQQARIKALQEFIEYTLTFPDVYWVTNQQLLAWMMNPTDIAASRTSGALGCSTTPINSGVCDGISRRGQQCVWTDALTVDKYVQFSTCFSCPTRPPNVVDAGPVPPKTNPDICFVPDEGCPHPQIWDPNGCKCIATARLAGGTAPSRNFVLPKPIREWIPDGTPGVPGTFAY